MKQYIVSQKFRCCYNRDENDGTHISPLRFSSDVEVGTYSEKDFKDLVGTEFFDKGFFEKYSNIGWLKVVETKDITKKVADTAKKSAAKSLDIL